MFWQGTGCRKSAGAFTLAGNGHFFRHFLDRHCTASFPKWSSSKDGSQKEQKAQAPVETQKLL
jgi:hypothetical protein